MVSGAKISVPSSFGDGARWYTKFDSGTGGSTGGPFFAHIDFYWSRKARYCFGVSDLKNSENKNVMPTWSFAYSGLTWNLIFFKTNSVSYWKWKWKLKIDLKLQKSLKLSEKIHSLIFFIFRKIYRKFSIFCLNIYLILFEHISIKKDMARNRSSELKYTFHALKNIQLKTKKKCENINWIEAIFVTGNQFY